MKRKYNVGGREIMGEDVDFHPEKELFNVYILEDGTTLKMKAVISKIIRLDEYGPDGNPLYMVTAQNVMVTDCPPQLQRSPQ
jgi:hypothetical protein